MAPLPAAQAVQVGPSIGRSWTRRPNSWNGSIKANAGGSRRAPCATIRVRSGVPSSTLRRRMLSGTWRPTNAQAIGLQCVGQAAGWRAPRVYCCRGRTSPQPGPARIKQAVVRRLRQRRAAHPLALTNTPEDSRGHSGCPRRVSARRSERQPAFLRTG